MVFPARHREDGRQSCPWSHDLRESAPTSVSTPQPDGQWLPLLLSTLYAPVSFRFGQFVLMCLCPMEDDLGWQSGRPFNTKAEKETLSFGSSQRGCIRRRKRLGLKAGWVDETLDELFWPLLLLFYVRRTFHSKYCFYVGVGEGNVNFSVGNTGRERIPKDRFLCLWTSDVWCGRKEFQVVPQYTHIILGPDVFTCKAGCMTRRNIRNRSTKVTTCSMFSWSWGEREFYFPNVVWP